jgi:hypothetical protein
MPLDENFFIDTQKADLSPWLETPSSSRVARMRYDHGNSAVQVQWTNGKNRGYVYGNFPYEQYRSFARAASRGKHVNYPINGRHPYRLMTGEEAGLPSNNRRRGIRSKVRD